jgi:hypothetical protein
VAGKTLGSGNASGPIPSSAVLLCCVERGKVSAGPLGRLWDMPLPAGEAADQVSAFEASLARRLSSLVEENRERELGLDRRETG